MIKQGKLELTWVGKYEEKKIEPRILVEDKSKSYGDPDTENMLIHGDNLIALKSLEQDFAGKIKCIYIDPPYNTGSRINADGEEVFYEDGLEHSEWLTMMYPRLVLLKNLMHEDGTMCIQIDDKEYARLYLILIEIFGESNLKTICVKMSEPTGVKMAHVVNSGRIPKLKEYIIVARKNGIKDLYLENVPKEKWDNEYKTLLMNISKEEIGIIKSIRDDDDRSKEDVRRCDEILSKITTKSLSEIYRENRVTNEKDKINYNFENAWRIAQIASMSGGAKGIADKKRQENDNDFFSIVTPQNKMYLIRNHYDIEKNIPRIKVLFADDYLTVNPGDFWQDIKTTGLDNEGGVDFKKGKKPETLIKRVITMASNEGDIVLDSFAGSGTSAAVAHKLKRKWITIEMANHCYSHVIPRIKSVIDGTDMQGITSLINWRGGGGFKFYELAESLLVKNNKLPVYQINPSYTFDMMTEAICKLEGFKYKLMGEFHGTSSENRFIHVTTEFVNSSYVISITKNLDKKQSLLIYCTKKQSSMRLPENVEIKKIPKDLLAKCNFESEAL